jgi:hypothetical protein
VCDETTDDWWGVETLYDLTFAPRPQALSSSLRDDVPAYRCVFCRGALGRWGDRRRDPVLADPD